MDENAERGSGQAQPDTSTIPTASPPFDGYDFRSLVPPTTVRPNKWTKLSASYIIKDAFRLRTLLAIGAGLQMALSAAIKKPWCFIPTAVLLAIAPTITLFQMILPSLTIRGHRLKHAFLAGVVPGRSTTHLPSSTGRYLPGIDQNNNKDGRKEGLVVFHFGARFNHPLGVFAPGARTMTRLFRATIEALEAQRTAYGLLGADLFRGGAQTRVSNDTILLVLYFRDVEGLQRFAGSDAHQQAYRWLRELRTEGSGGNGSSKESRYPHLSAFHETFVVPAGNYETLYINTAPILLGNTFTERATVEGEDNGVEDDKEKVWLNSLVGADDVRLRTMAARLKRSL